MNLQLPPIDGSRPPTKVPLTPDPLALAPNVTARLTARLRALGQNVSGLENFADSEPAALRWGEATVTEHAC